MIWTDIVGSSASASKKTGDFFYDKRSGMCCEWQFTANFPVSWEG